MRFHIGIVVTLIGLVSGCTSISFEKPDVSESVALQQEVLANPLFAEILRELEQGNGIEWSRRTGSVEEDLAMYSSNTEWAISKFETEGSYTVEQVGFWWKWNPGSSTTAATVTCGETTRLNRWRLDRNTLAITNTLIHERNHSFCLTHPDDQTRPTNKCDFSYISGDLAESLLVASHGEANHVMSSPMCPSLCAVLEDRDLPHGCKPEELTLLTSTGTRN